ncbi:hypothetical protein HK098_007768 [Nowakowskiella sp. JEL0407]|nr:hypothetical protein HK098_007768 [Nowakowskiella sp. JEL0407]
MNRCGRNESLCGFRCIPQNTVCCFGSPQGFCAANERCAGNTCLKEEAPKNCQAGFVVCGSLCIPNGYTCCNNNNRFCSADQICMGDSCCPAANVVGGQCLTGGIVTTQAQNPQTVAVVTTTIIIPISPIPFIPTNSPIPIITVIPTISNAVTYTPEPVATVQSVPDETQNGGLAPPTIAGIVAACLIILGCVLLAWCLRTKKKFASEEDMDDSSFKGPGSKEHVAVTKVMTAIGLGRVWNGGSNRSSINSIVPSEYPQQRQPQQPVKSGFQFSLPRNKDDAKLQLSRAQNTKKTQRYSNVPPSILKSTRANSYQGSPHTVAKPLPTPNVLWFNSIVTAPYNPTQPSELVLHPGDKLMVRTCFSDGWAHGSNLRTGYEGYFPYSCCVPAEPQNSTLGSTGVSDQSTLVSRAPSTSSSSGRQEDVPFTASTEEPVPKQPTTNDRTDSTKETRAVIINNVAEVSNTTNFKSTEQPVVSSAGSAVEVESAKQNSLETSPPATKIETVPNTPTVKLIEKDLPAPPPS